MNRWAVLVRDRWDEALAATVLAVMLLLGLLNVVLRYGFGFSLPWAIELSRYLLVWLTFFGALAALRRNEHIALSFDLVSRLPPALARILNFLIDLAVVGFLLVLVVYGWELARAAASTRLITLPWISVAWLHAGMVAAAGVMTWFVLHRSVRRILGKS